MGCGHRQWGKAAEWLVAGRALLVASCDRGGGGGHAKLGMAKFGLENLWHQFLNITENFGTEFPDCGTTSTDCECGCYFLWAFGWLQSFPGGFWMLVGFYRHIAAAPTRLPKGRANCTGTRGLCIPRASTMAPRKMATDLKIPWHNLANSCCATFCCMQLLCVVLKLKTAMENFAVPMGSLKGWAEVQLSRW